MKLIKGLIALLILAVAVIAVLVICKKPSEAQKIEAESKNAAVSVKDAVTDAVKVGAQTVGETATNASQKVTTSVQEAGVVATNVAAKVKGATTNAVGEVKQEYDKLTH